MHKKRFYKRVWFWALVVIAGLVIIGGIASQGAKSNLSDLDYLKESVTVEKQTVKKTITTTGTIVPDYTESITAAGTVTDLPHGVGDDVDKNDTLIVAGGATVKAPFSGRITSLNAVVDGQASPTVPVMEFSYRSNHIEFFASESEVIDLKEGQKVRFSIPSYNSGKDEFEGEVTFVDLAKQAAGVTTTGAAQESGYRVKISMKNLPDELSKVLGLTVDMTIDVASVDNVAALSSSAIQYSEDGQPFVYELPTIDAAFAAKARAADDVTTELKKKYIKTGLRGDRYIEITEGLNVGDSVLIYVPKTETGSFF